LKFTKLFKQEIFQSALKSVITFYFIKCSSTFKKKIKYALPHAVIKGTIGSFLWFYPGGSQTPATGIEFQLLTTWPPWLHFQVFVFQMVDIKIWDWKWCLQFLQIHWLLDGATLKSNTLGRRVWEVHKVHWNVNESFTSGYVVSMTQAMLIQDQHLDQSPALQVCGHYKLLLSGQRMGLSIFFQCGVEKLLARLGVWTYDHRF